MARCHRLPWEYQAIIPARRKALRQTQVRVKKDDINMWLSEYQRSYQQRPKDRRNPVTPGWVPVYNAQLKRKAGKGTRGWAVGAGDGPVDVTATRDHGQNSDSLKQKCYQHQHSHPHCYRGHQTDSDDRRDQGPFSENVRKGLYQDHQQPPAVTTATTTTNASSTTGHNHQAQDHTGYGSSHTPGDSGGQHAWSVSLADPNLSARARAEKNRRRSDSGLSDHSVALCMWIKNDKTCPTPFSCLPWQQQVAQTTLEARAFASHRTGQRIF